MVARFMGKRERQAGRSDFAMANQTAEQTYAFFVPVEKRLRIGKLDSEVHVVGNLRKARLESSKKAPCTAARPGGIDWPQQPRSYGCIEQRHARQGWQRPKPVETEFSARHDLVSLQVSSS